MYRVNNIRKSKTYWCLLRHLTPSSAYFVGITDQMSFDHVKDKIRGFCYFKIFLMALSILLKIVFWNQIVDSGGNREHCEFVSG